MAVLPANVRELLDPRSPSTARPLRAFPPRLPARNHARSHTAAQHPPCETASMLRQMAPIREPGALRPALPPDNAVAQLPRCAFEENRDSRMPSTTECCLARRAIATALLRFAGSTRSASSCACSRSSDCSAAPRGKEKSAPTSTRLMLVGSSAMRSRPRRTLAFMPRRVSRASGRVPSCARISRPSAFRCEPEGGQRRQRRPFRA